MHAYITSNPDICGGEPVISGTRMTVRSITQYVLHQGLTPEELQREFDHLNLSQIYDALSYYYDHKSLIDKLIAENSAKN